MKRAGRGEGPRSERVAVCGRESWRPRVWKGRWVSPRPWRRRRMERAGWVGGGVRRREGRRGEGKSAGVEVVGMGDESDDG